MEYKNFERDEYKEIPLLDIGVNKNDLPFFIARPDPCNNKIHRHRYIQLIYVCRGRLRHAVNNNIFDIVKGDIFIIPPFIPHHFISDDTNKAEIIEFEFIPEFIQEDMTGGADTIYTDFAYLEPFFVTENIDRPRLNLTGRAQEEVERILNDIILEYNTRDSDFSLMIKSLTFRLLVIIGRTFRINLAGTESYGLYERHRDALDKALKYVDEHYNCSITIDEVAKIAIMSKSYYRYLFKQLMQKPFNEYLNSLRISRAVEMLRDSRDTKIADICYSVGFNNVNHFNRLFKKETGVTPMAYKKAKNVFVRKTIQKKTR